MKKQYSIRFLLLAALAAAFSLVLVFTVIYSADSQRDHLEEFSHKYVDGLAKSYFDGLNTMMVTGTIGNRIRNNRDGTIKIIVWCEGISTISIDS